MKALQDRRVWIAAAAVLTLLLIAGSYMLLISPQQDSTAALRDQAAQTQTQNAALQAKTAKLKRESQHLDQLTSGLRAALAALPSDSGVPAFTREVRKIATATGVSLDTIQVTPPVLAGATAGTTGGTGGTATAPTTTNGAAAAGQLYTISATVNTDATLAHEIAFTKALRHGARAALVTGVQGTGGTTVALQSKFTVTMTLFSVPMTAQQATAMKKLLAGDITS